MADSIAEMLHLKELLETPGEVRRIREDAGLSADVIARQLEVTPSTVTRWETGARMPRGANARRYARLLRRLAGPATAAS